jgi:endonuclease-3
MQRSGGDRQMTAKSNERVQLARAISRRLKKLYPDATCALRHENPLQLLIATILSAQCTDERVNKVTPELFRKYPNAEAFAVADQQELERAIQSTGFFRNKAKNIRACCQLLMDKFGGRVPKRMEDMLELPGVARKTANVVLGTAFRIASGVVVDTHVARLSQRMGLTQTSDPNKIERDLCALLPKLDWIDFAHRMIWHGRRVCTARKPACNECALGQICPKLGVPS